MFNVTLTVFVLFVMFIYVFFFFNSEKFIHDKTYYKRTVFFVIFISILIGSIICNMPEYGEYKTQQEINDLKQK